MVLQEIDIIGDIRICIKIYDFLSPFWVLGGVVIEGMRPSEEVDSEEFDIKYHFLI